MKIWEGGPLFTFLKLVRRQVERIIEEADFEFACANVTDGCPFVGGRKELRDHEDGACEFRRVRCAFLNCGKLLMQRDLAAHLAQDHLPCVYQANGCEFTGTRGHLLWHEDECVFRVVQCPHGKCEETVKVKKD